MDKIGCTTPYGIKNDDICKDQNKRQQAIDLYEKLWSGDFSEKCPYPCRFQKNKLLLQNLDPTSFLSSNNYLIFSFEKYVKTTEFYLDYTELELLAEFGGYVGLFLGISVFDLKDVFNAVLQSMFS